MPDKIQINEIMIEGKKGSWFTEDSTAHVREVIDRIRLISIKAQENHDEGANQITRVVTDEYSFYPPDHQFSIEDYKFIIDEVARMADSLSPNIHLMLATFPVIGADQCIHNCGLYIQSPNKPGDSAILHHFSKTKFPVSEFYCKEGDGGVSIPTAILPQSELIDTRISIGDINQYGSAIKITTANATEFFVTIGICKEHEGAIEREQLHGLIDQLKKHHKETPLYCSHILTSNKIKAQECCVLSTFTHVDPVRAQRQEHFSTSPRVLHVADEKLSMDVECYQTRSIGTMHSDLFLHALSDKSAEEISLMLKHPQDDTTGNTLLHQVILNIDSIELTAKRLYIMILCGADPDLKNSLDQSVRMVAEALPNEQKAIIIKAINAGLDWRDEFTKINAICFSDGQTALTRELAKDRPSIHILEQLILKGANPYLEDSRHISAWDNVKSPCSEEMANLKKTIIEATFLSQYGYYDSSLCKRATKAYDRFQIRSKSLEYRFLLPVHSQTEAVVPLKAELPTVSDIDNVQSKDLSCKYKTEIGEVRGAGSIPTEKGMPDNMYKK